MYFQCHQIIHYVGQVANQFVYVHVQYIVHVLRSGLYMYIFITIHVQYMYKYNVHVQAKAYNVHVHVHVHVQILLLYNVHVHVHVDCTCAWGDRLLQLYTCTVCTHTHSPCSETGPRCPVDNTKVYVHQLFKDNFAKREVLSLNVHCSADQCGCSWQGELRDLQVHHYTHVHMYMYMYIVTVHVHVVCFYNFL